MPFFKVRTILMLASTAAAAVFAAVWIQQTIEMHATNRRFAELGNSVITVEAQISGLHSNTEKIRNCLNARLAEINRAELALSPAEQRERNVWRIVRVMLAKREHALATKESGGDSASDGEIYISKYSGNVICPELLTDPEYAKNAKLWWRYQVCEKSPMGVYTKSVLTTDVRNQVLDALVEQDFQGMELGMLSSRAGIDRMDISLREERGRLRRDSEMHIRKLLGEERYLEFGMYHGLPQTNELADQLENRLSYTAEPLTTEQNKLIHTARPRDLDGMDDNFDEKLVDGVVAQAAEWLTPSQYVVLQKLRADQKAYVKVYGSWTGRGL